MINYSGLPSRVRRIVKQYEYCIESVINDGVQYVLRLKEGYQGNHGLKSVVFNDSTDVIYFLKSVTKPSSRNILVALYGFSCPIDGRYVPKGSNYIDLEGLKLCTFCGLAP
jgi:hypothetical protein